MATKARRAGSLATILNANTSAASNTVLIDSGGDISLTGNLTVSSGVIGYATNAHLQATFAQNSYFQNVRSGALEVSNANITFVTKATALASNTALINLINDRIQVANADVKYLTKATALASNTTLVNLINDRIQAANVDSTIATYWPSANVIAYTNSVVGASTKNVNTSIYIASGGENRVAIPYTNTNFMLVYLNGVLLTEDTDYVAANNVHIGNITPTLSQGDVLLVEEFNNHNTSTGSYGGGGAAYAFQGSTSGYTAGGSGPTGSVNTIDKFSFTSDANATDVGDLTTTRMLASGQSSKVSGYSTGGGGGPAPDDGAFNRIEKFPFASDANATDVGDQVTTLSRGAGQNSENNGYQSGGFAPPYTSFNVIQKFPFSSDSNSTDVGDLTGGSGGKVRGRNLAGQSSLTFGYASGGQQDSPYVSFDIIDKFPFSSDTNATDHADLIVPVHGIVGQSSTTHGYATGGRSPSCSPTYAHREVMQKFPFSSGTQATDVGNLSDARQLGAGQSSTTSGYTSGGQPANPSPKSNVIDKFSFESDGNATDVGDLTVARHAGAGQQI